MKYHIVIIIAVLLIPQLGKSQFYGGYAIGTSTSKTFKEYAEYLNADPNVTDELGNFWFSHGFTAGIEFPFTNMSAISFEYRRMTAQTNMTYSNLGRVDYKLTRNQYLVPASFGTFDGSKGSMVSAAFTLIVGLSNNSIERSYVDNPQGLVATETFSANQVNIGAGFTIMVANNHVGFVARLSWLGNLLPLRSDQSELSYNTLNRLEYQKDGQKEYVRSDFRGVSLEIGLLLWLF